MKPLLLLLSLFITLSAQAQKKTQCFESDGLKYQVTIQLRYLPGNRVTGTVSSKTYDDLSEESAGFTGTLRGNRLYISFKGKRPVVGDGSEWRDKPWQLRRKDGKEVLAIVFYSKSYETGKWSNTPYEFVPCP